MFLLGRVKEAIPPNLKITENSTPIPYFGQYKKSKACTISLNPSDREFCNKNGEILDLGKERLCSRVKLNRQDEESLTDSEAQIILEYCNNYFNKKPYKMWFDKYEKFLNCFEYSYYDNSVVHLDLVQWATTPFWRELPTKVKDSLLARDLPFLQSLLTKDFECIFLNGLTTVTEVSKHLNINLDEIRICFRGKNSKIFFGWHNDSRVVGWSPYLQSASVGGYEFIEKFANIVLSENTKHLTNKIKRTR